MPEETIIVKKQRKVISEEEKAARKQRQADTRLANKGLFSAGDRENKFRFVKDQLLRTTDVAGWDAAKFLSFFVFMDRFYAIVFGKGKIEVTILKIQLCEQVLSEFPEDPMAEFLWRINRWSEPYDGSVHKKFYIRLASMMRIVFGYLKQNPAVVTEEIKEHCKGKIQYAWILSNTRVVTTRTGASVVEHDNTGFTGNMMTPVTSADTDKTMMDAILQVGSILNMLSSGITKKDIDKLNVKDKINAIQKLLPVANIIRNFKPNGNTFKQINIYKAGKDELEAALIDFTKQE